MSCGIEQMELIAALDMSGDWWLLKCPEQYYNAFDGTNLDDNGLMTFAPEKPTKAGVYKLGCTLHWDDGDNGMFDRTDPDWYFDVDSVTELYTV